MKRSRFVSICLAWSLTMVLLVACSTEKSPTEVQTHPVGWNEMESPVFHGIKVVDSRSYQSCESCHGEGLAAGGESGIACTDCHNSGAVESPIQHPQRVRNLGWDLENCTVCHGEDYTGRDASANCTTSGCHIRDEGPEACNTCHGDFGATFADGELSLNQIAPPADLEGETRPLSIGVGLHQYHIQNEGLTCIGCHAEVNEFDDGNHIDGDGIAEVRSRFIRSWNRNTGTCTSACHMEGGEPVEKQWIIQ